MNSRGVYTPEQVSENTEYYWNRYAESGASTVDKATAAKIVKATVNYLGGIGSGARYSEENFESKYKVADPLGMEKNLQTVLCVMITSLISKWAIVSILDQCLNGVIPFTIFIYLVLLILGNYLKKSYWF